MITHKCLWYNYKTHILECGLSKNLNLPQWNFTFRYWNISLHSMFYWPPIYTLDFRIFSFSKVDICWITLQPCVKCWCLSDASRICQVYHAKKISKTHKIVWLIKDEYKWILRKNKLTHLAYNKISFIREFAFISNSFPIFYICIFHAYNTFFCLTQFMHN